MIHMVSGMFCFVTATVSFLYGTRILWVCGKKCNFVVAPAEKKQSLKATIPGGFVVYFLYSKKNSRLRQYGDIMPKASDFEKR